MKFHLTDKGKNLITGVIISIILILTPFLFYLYKFAPADETTWHTVFGTIESGGFNSVQNYIHALFTKSILVIISSLWFLSCRDWWKWAILVPFTMFLFQFSGVINHQVEYIDRYDFWDALPFILPIVFFLIFISYRLSKKVFYRNLDEEANEVIKNMFSDKM